MRNPVQFVQGLVLIASSLAWLPTSSAQSVDSLSPARTLRGTTTEITIVGEDLDLVEGVLIEGSNAGIESFIIDDSEHLRVRLSVGDRAERGLRDLTLTGDAPVVLTDAIEFAAGPVQLLSISPASGSRSERVPLTLTGRNLDVVTGISLGMGITVGDFLVVSPISATANAEIGVGATSGSRSMEFTSAQGPLTFASVFEINGGAVSVGRVSPSTVVRGEDVMLTLSGENLDRLVSVDAGPRIQVLNTTIDSPVSARVQVRVQPEAARGSRAITVSSATETVTLPDAFAVNAGVISANRLLPDQIRQRQSLTFTVDGANLDGATAVDAGPGLEISEIDAAFPSALTFVITADDDATTGPRDVTITAPGGTITLTDALTVGERLITPPRLLITEEVTLPEAEVGSRTSAVALIENLGEETETIRFAPAQGDTDLFVIWNLNASDEREPFTPELELESEASQRFLIEFTPEFRALSGVFWSITARDGEAVGTITAEGRGLLARLFVDSSEPLTELERAPGASVPLPRVRTRLDSGVLARSVLITDVSAELSLDGELVDPALVEFELERTTTGDDFFWGFTEISWSLTDPADGYYEGALLLETDRPSAATFIVPFAVLIADGAGGDTGEPADAGIDASSDAGSSDAGPSVDASSDVVTQPDTSGGSDADDGADSSSDAVTDGDTEPADAGSGGGSGGGCVAAPDTSDGLSWVVVALAVFGRRRRQRAVSNT